MSYNPYRVCLRIGTDVVASNQHFPTWDAADKVRQQLLSSKTIAGQKPAVGVIVLHYKKFKELIAAGNATTIARLRANERLLGRGFAQTSPVYTKVEEIQDKLTKEFDK